MPGITCDYHVDIYMGRVISKACIPFVAKGVRIKRRMIVHLTAVMCVYVQPCHDPTAPVSRLSAFAFLKMPTCLEAADGFEMTTDRWDVKARSICHRSPKIRRTSF